MSKPRLQDEDFCKAAKRLKCEVAAIRSVCENESLGGGFDSQDRPKILFERHLFHKFTNGKFDASHPDISNRTPGGYGSSTSQYSRFNKAFTLDSRAALMATSWGMFQILGMNYAVCGYKSLVDFMADMRESEGKHLKAFCGFVESNGLDDELRRKNWTGFARGYNGAGYKKNAYDTKLAAAYKKFSKQNIDCEKISTVEPSPVQSSPIDTDQQIETTTNQPADSPVADTQPSNSILDKANTNLTKAQTTLDALTNVSKQSFIASVITKFGGWITMLGAVLLDNWEIAVCAGIIILAGLIYLHYSRKRAHERTMAILER